MGGSTSSSPDASPVIILIPTSLSPLRPRAARRPIEVTAGHTHTPAPPPTQHRDGAPSARRQHNLTRLSISRFCSNRPRKLPPSQTIALVCCTSCARPHALDAMLQTTAALFRAFVTLEPSRHGSCRCMWSRRYCSASSPMRILCRATIPRSATDEGSKWTSCQSASRKRQSATSPVNEHGHARQQSSTC